VTNVDWILTRGEVVTFDRARPRAEAVAIAAGRVVAVGPADEIEALATSKTIVTMLDGAAVMPGLCDTHMHLQKVSRDFAMFHPAGCSSIAEVCDAVRVAAAATPSGQWIRTFADTERWHERFLQEQRLPTSGELDSAAADHPVFLYRRNDAAVLNAVAVGQLSSWLAERPEGDWDAETGRLSGASVRALNDRLYHEDKPSLDRELELLGLMCKRLLGMGITSVVDPGLAAGFAHTWELYCAARAGDLLPFRVHLMNRLDYRLPFTEELERLRSSPALPFDGDPRLRAWAVKILLDGEFSNAWLADGQVGSGEPAIRYTPTELDEIVTLCAERRWPLCVHVMGGGAVDAVIEAVRSVVARGLPILPGQVSLAHAFLADERDVVECANYGIAVSVQPLLAYVFAREMLDAWGEVARRSIPVSTMLRAGLVVAGGSDTLPCEPLFGAHLAVSRALWDGGALAAEEAIAPEQALALFTRNAGEYVGWRHVGVIREGCFADVAVWPQNLLGIDSERWAETQPLLVAIDGVPAWGPLEGLGPVPAASDATA
jgi:predicted amidohydrolase YtcJ